MNTSRRSFLAASALAGTSLAVSGLQSAEPKVTKADLDKILNQPVLNTSFIDRPVIVESIELLKSGNNWLVRSRSTDGVEAITRFQELRPDHNTARRLFTLLCALHWKG